MKYVNLMGPMDDLDRVIDTYLSRYEIQLEYTAKERAAEKELSQMVVENPYTPILRRADRLTRMTGIERKRLEGRPSGMGRRQAINVITYAEKHFDAVDKHMRELEERREVYKETLAAIEPFRSLDVRIEDLEKFEFIGYQFGRMPLSGFRQFETFLYNDSDLLLFRGSSDEQYAWCVYFAIGQSKARVDSLFGSLKFERVIVPTRVLELQLKGKLNEVCLSLSTEIDVLTRRIEADGRSLMEAADSAEDVAVTREEIIEAYKVIHNIEFYYDIRRFAAQTPNNFYVFVGWMTAREAAKLQERAADDQAMVVVIESVGDPKRSRPPTKLRNPLIFRPFELFVSMYGLPTYGELDPTVFVAITYTLLFGVMFADVGQGLVITVLGALLWKWRGVALGKVMGVIGLSGAAFGLLFGSFFGIEITPVLFHPADKANMTLVSAVLVGVALILTPMLLNIINAARRGELLQALFDQNGFAGLFFYALVAVTAALTLLGRVRVNPAAVIALAAVPFVMILLRDVFRKLIRREKLLEHGGPVMYGLETVIEMFEVLLTYFTNTVSFVRVGAFALSHASMMGVVMMLAGAETGSPNVAVLVIGNIFVIGLEGLIVGIQALRLEFYEMFSRFYDGGGHLFKPYKLGVGKS